MGYFSNATEGDIYADKYCSRCVHGDRCSVWLMHLVANYAEANNTGSMLHVLIPMDGIKNQKCTMFHEADK